MKAAQCLTAVLVTLTACSSGPRPADPGWSETTGGLKFRIRTDKPTYRPGENIVLNIEFANEESRPMQILVSAPSKSTDRKATLNMERVIITADGAQGPIEFLPPGGSAVNRILGPGTHYSESVRLSAVEWRIEPSTGALPTSPGNYSIQAVYAPASQGAGTRVLPGSGLTVWSGSLRSNIATFSIR